jgi:dihydroorotate dehydrogenase
VGRKEGPIFGLFSVPEQLKKEKSMLMLNGTKFGSIFCATGARGFYGEGYPFHRYWRYFGMDWSGTGFSGKTLTLPPRPGNMPLREDGTTPKEFAPRCIWVSFRNGGEMMNAVGLSNFGAEYYLKSGHYHKIQKPFFISFMCMAGDRTGREAELRDFCHLLKQYLPFRVAVALQENFGCPNSGHDLSELQQEICTHVEIAKSILGIPVVINTNALMPTDVLLEAAQVVDGFWIGNTISFRDKATDGKIDWSQYGEVSPIRRRGIGADGGLSSPQCLPLTVNKVWELRESGISLPIVAGNGIRDETDIDVLETAGADAVFVGSLAVVRPRRMRTVVDYARWALS